MLLYSAGSVGAGAFYAFNNFVLPPILKSFGAPDLLTGLLASTRSIEGTVIQPTVGAISDRTWTRIGRRRPFIVVAIPLSAAFFVLSALANDLLLLAIGIVLFSIFFNIAVDPYAALLPDISPPKQRGLLSGIANGIQLASQVAFLVAAMLLIAGGAAPLWLYVLTAAILLVGFGVTAATIAEPRELTAHVEHMPFRMYLDALLTNQPALRYLVTVFVYQFGFSAVQPYLTLFLTTDIGMSEDEALGIAALALLVTGLGAVGFGKLADRVGHRMVLAIGWSLLAVGAVSGTVIHGIPQTVAVAILVGVGNGAATAVKWPLLTLLIPPEKTGVYAGLIAAADSVAIPLSVGVAAIAFLPVFGYRGIFAMLAVFIVLAVALLLLLVRVPRPSEIAAVQVAQ